MVAIVSGNSLGLSLTSLATLGQPGAVGSSVSGRSGEQVFVNASNGNLVLQDQDEYIAARGSDVSAVRTYNSEGTVTDAWAVGVVREKIYPPATWGAGTLVRVGADGAEAIYAWDGSKYLTTSGGGVHDSVNLVAGQYVWTDGATQSTETYDSVGRLVSSADANGNATTYAYDASSRLSTVTGANGERLTYVYYPTGELSDLKTSVASGAMTRRVHYEYDLNSTGHRLTSVWVDLTPADGTYSDSAYVTSYTYEGTSARIATVTQQDGSKLTFTYDASQRVKTITDALNRVANFDYSVALQTTITDPASIATVIKYDASGQLKQVNVGGQLDRTFAYQSNGDLWTVTDGANQTTTFTYDAAGNLVSQVDALQNTVNRSYNSVTNTIDSETVFHVAGATPGSPATSRYVYSALKPTQLRFSVTAQGRVTEYQYDPTAFGQRTAQLVYDAATYSGAFTEAALTTWAASQSVDGIDRTDMTYDVRGQLASTTKYASVSSAAGHPGNVAGQSVSSYLYYTSGQVWKVIEPAASGSGSVTTEYFYDGMGRETKCINTLGQITITTYDDVGMKTAVKLANNMTTTRTFDKAGNLVTVAQLSSTSADLGTTRYAYDSDNRLIMKTDATGVRTFTLYDTQGRLGGQVDGDGTLTEYLYDLDDRLSRTVKYTTAVTQSLLADGAGNALNPTLSAIRPAGAAATDKSEWRLFDSAGRLMKEVDAEGAVTEYTYDGASLVVAKREYANRLTSAQMAALGDAPSSGLVAPAVDAANDRVSRNFYDSDNLLTGTLDGDGYLKQMTYDAAGHLAQVKLFATLTNAGDRAAGTFAALLATASAGGGHETTTYLRNAKGQVSATIDTLGFLTEYGYDLSGRQNAVTRYAAKVTAAYTTTTAVDSIRPSASVGQDQNTTCTFDDLGRCIQQKDALGNITSHTYDLYGNLTQSTTSVGQASAKTSDARRYDELGRLSAQLNAEGFAKITVGMTQAQIDNVWATYGVSFAYDLAGRRISQTDSLGNKTLFFYDKEDRLTHTVDALGGVIEKDYDALDNKFADIRYQAAISTTSLTGGLVNTTLTSRIATAANAAKDIRLDYKYLRDGRVKSVKDANQKTTYYFYDAFGEPVYTVDGAGDVQYMKYDPDGRLVQTTQYAKLVTGVTSTTTTAQLIASIATDASDLTVNRVYDMDGRLMATINAIGDVERFWYDTSGNLIDHRTYVNRLSGWTPGSPVNTVDDAKDLRVRTLYDAFHRAIYSINAIGEVVTQQYDANGNLVKRTAYSIWANAPSFDGVNPLLPSTSPTDSVTTFGYDSDNRLVWMVDGAGGVTRRYYDRDNHVTQLVEYATASTPGTFVTSKTASPGYDRITNYIYDKLGRQTFTVDSVGTVTGFAYDNNGNVTQRTEFAALAATKPVLGSPVSTFTPVANAADRTTHLAYDAANRLVYTVDAIGAVTENVYDGASNVTNFIRYATAMSAANLSSLTSTATIAQIKAKFTVSASLDRTTMRTFNGVNRQATSTDNTSHSVATTYDGLGRVSTRKDKSPTTTDRVTTYAYDGSGRLYSVTDAMSQTEYYGYDGAGNKRFFQNKKGAEWTYTYDSTGKLLDEATAAVEVAVTTDTTYTPPVAVVLHTAYSYDALGHLKSVTEAAGRAEARVTRYYYDAMGRRVRTELPAEKVYTLESDVTLASNGQGSSVSRAAEAVTVLSTETYYDALGNATGFKDVAGIISYKVYDQVGRVVNDVDALRYVTAYTYNAFSEKITQTRYASVSTVTGTPTKLPTTFTPVTDSANDRTITTAYDKMGRVDTVTEPAGYVYDSLAAGAAQYYTAANTTKYRYSTFGEVNQVSRTRNQAGATYDEYRYYDRAGNLSATVDAAKFITVFAYDGVGNLDTRTEYAKAIVGTVTSAAQPNPVADSVNDRVTTYGWDQLNRKISETRLNVAYTDQDSIVLNTVGNVTTGWGYDALGNVLTATTFEGTTYTYYDALSRVVAIADPVRAGETSGTLTPLTTFVRDAFGNAVAQTQFAKGALSVTGSAPTAITDAADRTSYAYYDNGGHALHTLDANGTHRYAAFDAEGHLAKEWLSIGTGGATATLFKAYSYDALGRLIRVIEPKSSSQVSGSTVTAVAQSVAGVTGSDIRYNAFGEVTSRGTAGNFEEKNDYDKAGRLWRSSAGDGVTKIYLYDQLGNRTAQISSAGNQDLSGGTYTATAASTDTSLRRTDWNRDALGRVLKETLSQRAEDYGDTNVRATSVGSAVTEATATWNAATSQWEWSGTSSVTLTWSSLSGLGNGEVKVEIAYTQRLIAGTDGGGGPVFADGSTAQQQMFLTSEDGAAGATFTIDAPAAGATTGSIAHLDVVTVSKKDSNGFWVQVAYNDLSVTPPFVSKVLEVQRADEAVVTDVQLWDTQAGTPQWYSIKPGVGSPPVWHDFGDRYQVELGAYDPTRYKYQVIAKDPAGATKVLATGFLSTLGSTDGGAANWRPVINRTYDRWGNIASISDASGTGAAVPADWITTYTYDAGNRVLTQTRPGGITTRYGYDKNGRRVQIKDANAHVNRWRYDTQGNLIQEIHADGGIVNNTYDGFNQRRSTVDAENNKDVFTYDSAGHQTAVSHFQASNANFAVYSVTRNGESLTLGARVDKLSLDESATFDAAGRKISQTNAAGETIQYIYDLRGNIIRTELADGSRTYTAFDVHDRAVGEMAGEAASTHSFAKWSYDVWGRFTTGAAAGHTDIGGATYTYTYDLAGQLKTQTNTRGQNLAYTYDTAGQLLKIVDGAQIKNLGSSVLVNNTKTTTYTYDLGGRKTSEKLVQNGITVQDNNMAFDNLGLLRWAGDSRASVNMYYDNVGNRTEVITHVVNTDQLTEYTSDATRYFRYDAMNRQTTVDAVDTSGTINASQGHNLTYDKNGNRVSDSYYGVKVTKSGTPATYDSVNNIMSSYPAGTYTAASGLVTETYRYDGMDRLKSVERDGIQVDRRLYDAAGRAVLTGGADNIDVAYFKAAYADGQGGFDDGAATRHTLSQFNNVGQLLEQHFVGSNAAGGDMNDNRIVFDAYDAQGNLSAYRAIDDKLSRLVIYNNTFSKFEGYRLSNVAASGSATGNTLSGYDANGQLAWLDDSAEDRNDRTVINDASGMTIATIQDGHIKRQMIVNSEVIGTYGSAVSEITPKNEDGSPIFDVNVHDFAFGYRKISASYPAAAPGSYTVKTGDSLRSLAQAVYGDARKWTQIAKANGLKSDSDLRVGQTITIPTVVTSGNGEHDFEPYQAGTMVGDTRPVLPMQVRRALVDPQRLGNIASAAGDGRIAGVASMAGATPPMAMSRGPWADYPTVTIDFGGGFDMGDFWGVDEQIEANSGGLGDTWSDANSAGDFGPHGPEDDTNTYNPSGQSLLSTVEGFTSYALGEPNNPPPAPPHEPTEADFEDVVPTAGNFSRADRADSAPTSSNPSIGGSSYSESVILPPPLIADIGGVVSDAGNGYGSVLNDDGQFDDTFRSQNLDRLTSMATASMPGGSSWVDENGVFHVLVRGTSSDDAPFNVLGPANAFGVEDRRPYVVGVPLPTVSNPMATSTEATTDLLTSLQYGWNREGWSVFQGDRSAYDFASGARTLVGAMTGYDSASTAISQFRQGNYLQGTMYGMQAFGEAGMTALTLGEWQLAKSAIVGALSERAAVEVLPPSISVEGVSEYRATLGSSTSNNYRETFLRANPDLEGEVIVHHGVEQQVLVRYPGAVSESEMHSLENLRGIPKEANSDLHLSAIRLEWNRFYRNNPSATQQQLLDKATEIDLKYGVRFNPPVGQ